MVTLTDVEVKKVRFPAAPGEESFCLAIIQKSVINKARLIALDRLEALVAILEAERSVATLAVNNDPPTIMFSREPTLLVCIDGDPTYRALKGTALQRVINTRCLIVRDGEGKHYLHIMDAWLEAPSINGPWTIAKHVRSELASAEKDAVASRQVDMLSGRSDPKKPGPSLTKVKPPTIHVVTSPTELIVTEGEPKFTDIPGTQLRYVENTTGHVFQQMPEKKMYVLISGRWFSADSMEGPWQYISGGKLPPDFEKLPDDSPKENVKASIPGTPQALEALIANAIPQTATVSRREARMDPPKFDGKPQWKQIDGTALHYAANTSWPVVQVKPDMYYAVENAIWFKAAAPNGPWFAADSVPAEIYSIPPSSPLHNVTLHQDLWRDTGHDFCRLHRRLLWHLCESWFWSRRRLRHGLQVQPLDRHCLVRCAHDLRVRVSAYLHSLDRMDVWLRVWTIGAKLEHNRHHDVSQTRNVKERGDVNPSRNGDSHTARCNFVHTRRNG